jgi:hypothetical protein
MFKATRLFQSIPFADKGNRMPFIDVLNSEQKVRKFDSNGNGCGLYEPHFPSIISISRLKSH